MDKNQEEFLVMRARRKDREAFEQLYTRIYKDLYKFALYTLGHPQDAEDVVADTITDMYLGIHKLRNPAAFRPWVFRILTNKCKQILKGYLNKTAPLDTELAMPDTNYAEVQDIRNAFAQLNAKECLLLSLTIFAGYNTNEAAKLMQLNPATARSIKSRALDKLKTILQY